MENIVKLIKVLFKVMCIATGVLFIIYFLNLDQKLMEWAYRRVNEIFDRKKQNLNF